MKSQKLRDQGNKATMRLEQLLRQALPAVDVEDDATRDLWPEMRKRLGAEAAPAIRRMPVPWLDWALGLGLAALLALVPAWIPVLLYCL